MLRTTAHSRSAFSGFDFLFNAPMLLWLLAMGLALTLLPIAFARSQPTAIESASVLLHDADPTVREQGINQLMRLGSAEATSELANFFQRDKYLHESGLATARALAEIGTLQAYQVLINALRQEELSTRHMAAMIALEEAKPSVTPFLTAALKDPDVGVRQAAAQIMGRRHMDMAVDALLAATHDPDASVREAASWALRGLGAQRSSVSQ